MRLTLVDTLSTILFFTILAALTELYVAGMESADVLNTVDYGSTDDPNRKALRCMARLVFCGNQADCLME